MQLRTARASAATTQRASVDLMINASDIAIVHPIITRLLFFVPESMTIFIKTNALFVVTAALLFILSVSTIANLFNISQLTDYSCHHPAEVGLKHNHD